MDMWMPRCLILFVINLPLINNEVKPPKTRATRLVGLRICPRHLLARVSRITLIQVPEARERRLHNLVQPTPKIDHCRIIHPQAQWAGPILIPKDLTPEIPPDLTPRTHPKNLPAQKEAPPSVPPNPNNPSRVRPTGHRQARLQVHPAQLFRQTVYLPPGRQFQ